jgi:hypothetical protein
MGRVVIVVYKPLKGKEAALENLVKSHHAALQHEKLVTTREPVLMRALDGSIVEVFEWLSSEAIEKAHTNPVVGQLWAKFNEVCTYEKPVDLSEFHNIFSEFESID